MLTPCHLHATPTSHPMLTPCHSHATLTSLLLPPPPLTLHSPLAHSPPPLPLLHSSLPRSPSAPHPCARGRVRVSSTSPCCGRPLHLSTSLLLHPASVLFSLPFLLPTRGGEAVEGVE